MKITSFFANMQSYQFIIFLLLVQVVIGFLVVKSKYRDYAGQILVITTILTISIVFYLITYQFSTMGGLSMGTTAATVPRLWIILIIPASIIFLSSVFKRNVEVDIKFGRLDIVCVVVLQLVISVLLFEYIGYYVASVLFLSTCIYFLGYRKVKTICIISISWIIFTYFVFHKILYVPLPVGKLLELFI